MSLFGPESWLRSPADRDIISTWTVGKGQSMSYALDIPQPTDGLQFLAIGDRGDTDFPGQLISPQEAVARELAADAAVPGSSGRAALVLHMGDVVYMTGERRLYDRNFRRPYAPFVCAESTVDNLIFRLPFLPVPGNHDYYDLGGWVSWVTHVPLLGPGVRKLTREIFAFNFPEGGSDRGKAYMDAFVDTKADTSGGPLPYRPGEQTRLPNRYYQFSVGLADFFALDSNTMDAAPPATVDPETEKAEANERFKSLTEQAAAIDAEFKQKHQACAQWRETTRREIANSPRSAELAGPAAGVAAAIARCREAMVDAISENTLCGNPVVSASALHERWSFGAETLTELSKKFDPEAFIRILADLDAACDETCDLLGQLDSCLGEMPGGGARSAILASRNALEETLAAWTSAAEPTPPVFCDGLRDLSEKALDIQRELALEKRRIQYSPQDFDEEQFTWLRDALEESVRKRPDAWRVVYLHHPLYTTIGNHCEGKDVRSVRDNLMPLLRDRVDLILTGHSHAFEWIRSSALPHTGLFVTGGGGQVSLRRSILNPRLIYRYRDRYEALRNSGVEEVAVGGRGPSASDGENGMLYHYLRVNVEPNVLTVRPVGIRRLAGGYRREEPMPVYYAPNLPTGAAPWFVGRLDRVEIRRGVAPVAVWE